MTVASDTIMTTMSTVTCCWHRMEVELVAAYKDNSVTLSPREGFN